MVDRRPEQLSVVVDEAIADLDAYLRRVVICCVEFLPEDEESIRAQLKVLKSKVKYFPKFHLTDIADREDKDLAIKTVCNLPLEAKVFTFYGSPREPLPSTKRRAITFAIRQENALLRNIKLTYFVEDASEYKGIINAKNLVSGRDDVLPFLADTVAAVYNEALSNPDAREWPIYRDQIRNLIRLELVRTEQGIVRLDRKNKL